MIPYILIIIILASTGISVTTQEFGSKATCEAAEEALVTTTNWRYYQITTKCVKK